MDQMSQELEGFMNEGLDDLDASRFGKIDKDYDTLCDQTPVKTMPKWQQWVSSIGGTLMVRAIFFKRYIAAQWTALKNKLSGKSNTTSLTSNGSAHDAH